MEQLERFVGIVQTITFVVLAFAAAIGTYLLPSDVSRTLVILLLGVAVLFPIKYRRAYVDVTEEGKSCVRYYIWMPYLLVGFCELAIIIFDRFKGK